jgi:hypothetical protein
MSPIYVPGKVVLAKEFTWNESVWNPSMISTALWLDAADASTVTTVSGAVSQWNDKSGNGRNVAQATADNRPAFTANAINGRPALDFDGSSHRLFNASAALQRNVPGTSVFTVTKLDVDTAGPKTIYQTLVAAGNTRALLNYRDGANTGFRAGGRRVSGSAFSSQGVSPYSDSVTLNSAIFNYNAATLSLIENGSITVNAAAFQNSGNTDNDAGQLYIGGDGLGGALWDGYIAEILVVHSAVSADTRQRIEGYLAHKWGLTANLPAGHPYKTVGPTP